MINYIFLDTKTNGSDFLKITQKIIANLSMLEENWPTNIPLSSYFYESSLPPIMGNFNAKIFSFCHNI